MKTKYQYHLCFLLVINLTGLTAWSQEPVTSHFFIPTQAVNPANVVYADEPGLLVNYRNQWPGMAASFVTYNLAYSHPLPRMNSGLGLWIENDVQGDGIFNRLSFSGTYGYAARLSQRNRLLFGLQGNLQQFSKNLSNLSLENNNESLVSESGFFLDFGLGLKLVVRHTYFGISARHLSPALPLFSAAVDYTPFTRFMAEAGTTIPLKSSGIYETIMDITPAVQISQQAGNSYLQAGAAIRRLNVQAGLWLRQDMQFHYDSFILSLGILQPTYNFVYSYDMRAPWNMEIFGKSGAHEVTFYIKFQYNEKRKRMRTIKCPDI